MAPGTVGSALVLAALWLAQLSRGGLLILVVAVTLVGLWAAGRAERLLGSKDPGAIVVDEAAGMALTVLPFPPTLPVLLTGFVLFRLYDVVKPPPARSSERLAGGVGVMADDLVAGLYALASLAALRALTGWP